MNKYTARVAELDGTWIFKDESPIHLTEAEITAFEQKIGYALPADYREFLRDFGGYSFYAFYPLPDGPDYLDCGDLGLMLGIMILMESGAVRRISARVNF